MSFVDPDTNGPVLGSDDGGDGIAGQTNQGAYS
jgi:hypothetical protein